MLRRFTPPVAGPARVVARSSWWVTGFDAEGVEVVTEHASTLRDAYLKRDSFLRDGCSVVVVETISTGDAVSYGGTS